jgi:hypothetical protein
MKSTLFLELLIKIATKPEDVEFFTIQLFELIKEDENNERK